jgi:nicotinamidase-related amidase
MLSKQIQTLVPAFRKAGIPVYAIHFSPLGTPASNIDFYQFAPHADDTLVSKVTASAFASSNIEEILKKDKRKLLLTCGFYLNACVESTVRDARKAGFDVCLLRDLTCNHKLFDDVRTTKEVLTRIRKKGTKIAESDKVLKYLRISKKHTGIKHTPA